MFQCHSPKSSHPCPLPQSPKVHSKHLCLFCCLAYRVIITIFLNSIYMCQYTVLVFFFLAYFTLYPYICCLQETHLKTRDTYRLKVKGWKKIFHANGDQKKAFESFLMRWMKLEPIIQSEVSQKEKHQYSMLTHYSFLSKSSIWEVHDSACVCLFYLAERTRKKRTFFTCFVIWFALSACFCKCYGYSLTSL